MSRAVGGAVEAGLEIDEVAALYRTLAARLCRIVGGRMTTAQADVEDACQVAWGRLVVHRAQVRRETAMAWLTTTALHEAMRQARRRRREVLVAAPPESAPVQESRPDALVARHPWLDQAPAVDELVQARLRLGAIRTLPARQRQLVWLQGLGLSYDEMARATGASRRTVERQLLRAKQLLRELDQPAQATKPHPGAGPLVE